MPTSREDLEWLESERTLEELQERFPREWERVQVRLKSAADQGRPGIDGLIRELAPVTRGTRDRATALGRQVSVTAQRRMVQQALRSVSDRAESGVEEGVIRLGRTDARLLQGALFAGGLVRKPANLLRFRIAWRLARGRNRLLPLVRAQGIYCFYSAALIRRLVRLVGGRRALEIAAGDGTLTRFLRDAGADVTATDDQSWSGRIAFPSWVQRADARTALRQHAPEVVLCSWPPAGNAFERDVFATASVQRYIVITSTDPREAGDRAVYESPPGFRRRIDPALSRLVLPRGRNQVLVFDRIG